MVESILSGLLVRRAEIVASESTLMIVLEVEVEHSDMVKESGVETSESRESETAGVWGLSELELEDQSGIVNIGGDLCLSSANASSCFGVKLLFGDTSFTVSCLCSFVGVSLEFVVPGLV